MTNVIRWHDHERAAKCWATEAKYRRLIANGLVPKSDDTFIDTAPCEYVPPEQDPA